MGVISTQAFTFRLIANGQQLDLFQDEDILLSNNVTGLFDIGVLPSDFTRQITIPGTKVNNAFFEHVYDISIDNPYLFATNQKVPAYFEFDSVYLSNGYLQLNQVNVVANKFIESYEITIYGTLSSFGRDINRLYLTDLQSLSQYNHTSSYDNLVASWSGSLFNGDIVYPLADYGNGWQYTQGEPLVNVGIDDNTSPALGLSVMDFKPAIRIKPVLDAIFTEAGYTYSSSFFAQDWISDVYMICNNSLRYPEYDGYNLEDLGVVKLSAFSGSGITDKDIPYSTVTNLPWYNVQKDPSNVIGTNSSYTLTLPHSSSIEGILNLNVNITGSLGGPNIRFIVRETGSLTTVSDSGIIPFNNYFTQLTNEKFAEGANGQNTTVELQAKVGTSQLGPGTYYFAISWTNLYSAPYNNITFTLDPGGQPKSYLEIKKVRQGADGFVLDIPSNMPYGTTGIKQIDFITGLQKKFNLVIYADKSKPNHFIIETFNNWYKRGEVKDFNKYINLDERIEFIPANNLAVNKLTFGDTLDQDYISQQFSKQANREYGKTYYVDNQNFYSQGEFNVKTTFASSPLLLVNGTGQSGSVSGSSGPGTNYQWSMGPSGYVNSYYACSSTYYYPNQVYTQESDANIITAFYTDPYFTTPFNGSGLVWKFYKPTGGGVYYSANVASNGIASNITQC